MGRKKRGFFSKQDGVAAIEYAILLPVIALLTVGGLDIALYMLKQNAAQRLINIAANTIPQDIAVGYTAIQEQGTGALLSFPKDGYICARSYRKADQAAAHVEKCGRGAWILQLNPPAIDTYYVGVKVFVKYKPIILRGMLPETFTLTAVVPVSPGETPPKCDDPGDVLQWDGSKWVCVENDEDTELHWYGAQGRLNYNGANAGCLSNNDHAFCPRGSNIIGMDLCNTGGTPAVKIAVLCEIPVDD